MSINFQGSKRSELAELQMELNHNKLERRTEAVKKVISLFVNNLGDCCYDSWKGCIHPFLSSFEMRRNIKFGFKKACLSIHYQLCQITT